MKNNSIEKQIKRTGGTSFVKKNGGNDELKLFESFDKYSVYDFCTEYVGIDENTYRFIEVPQGHIYKYDGHNVINSIQNQ